MAPSHFALMLIIILRNVTSQNDICVWGALNHTSLLNGQYTPIGTVNGKPYYRTSPPVPCRLQYYLFVDSYHGDWQISNVVDNSQYVIYCDLSDVLFNCTSWSDFSLLTDLQLSITPGPCPSWDCEQVFIPSMGFGCNTVFNVFIGTNTWADSSNTRFLYFDPLNFDWNCDDTYPDAPDYTDYCDRYASNNWERVLPFTSSEQGWTDLSNGQNASIYFYSDDDWLEPHLVYCMFKPPPTPKPTVIPTVIPTVVPPSTTIYGETTEYKRQGDGKVIELTTALTIGKDSVDDIDTTPDSFWTMFTIFALITCVICIVGFRIYCYKKANKKQNALAELVQHIGSHAPPPAEGGELGPHGEDGDDNEKETEDTGPGLTDGNTKENDGEKETEGQGVNSNAEPGSAPLSQVVSVVAHGMNDNRTTTKGDEPRTEDERELLKDWLSQKVRLPQYYDALVDNGYDTLDIIKEITDEKELTAIGIDLKGHVMKLMKEIQRLGDYLD
eukprot:913033_1